MSPHRSANYSFSQLRANRLSRSRNSSHVSWRLAHDVRPSEQSNECAQIEGQTSRLGKRDLPGTSVHRWLRALFGEVFSAAVGPTTADHTFGLFGDPQIV